jgi:hypothetical protein
MAKRREKRNGKFAVLEADAAGMRNLSGGSAVSAAICGHWRIGLHTAAFERLPWNPPVFIGFRCWSYWKSVGSQFIWLTLII